VVALARQLNLTNLTLTILGRAIYQKTGTADIEGFLKELGIQLPQ
jgi:hypothetical protein